MTFQCDECGSKAFAVRVVDLPSDRTVIKRIQCRTCGEPYEAGAVPTVYD